MSHGNTPAPGVLATRTTCLSGCTSRSGLRPINHLSQTRIPEKFLSLCDAAGHYQREPSKNLSAIQDGKRKLPHVLSNAEIGKLLLAPSSLNEGLRDRAILETMYSAGLRVSELVTLRDGDLDFDQGLIRVQGKGRKERLSPLGSYAIKAIKRYFRYRTRSSKTEALGRQSPRFCKSIWQCFDHT